MSRDPVRLEPWLTLDFVDRAEKLRGMNEQKWNPTLSKYDLAATWLVLIGLLIWIFMAW